MNFGVLSAVLSAFGGATLALWGKFAPETGLNLPTFLTFRFALTALALLAFVPRDIPIKERLQQLAFSAFYVLQTLLYFTALQQTSAAVTALLLYLAPAFVVLYEWLLGVKPTKAQLLGLGISSLGLIAVIGLPTASDGTPLGFLLAALAGASYAVFFVISGRVFKHANPIALTAHTSLGSAACFALLGIFTSTLSLPTSGDAWGVILGAVVFSSILAIPLAFYAVQQLGATKASLLLTLEPLFVTGLALVFLSEGLTLSKVIGGALIVTGALLAQYRAVSSTQYKAE